MTFVNFVYRKEAKMTNNIGIALVNLISLEHITRYQAALPIHILAGYLKHEISGVNVTLIDMQAIFDEENKKPSSNLEQSFGVAVAEVVQRISQICLDKPVIVGTSMKWGTQDIMTTIIDRVRQQPCGSRVLFVLGNTMSTYGYQYLLQDSAFRDVLAVVGEGEEALTSIVKIAAANPNGLTDLEAYCHIPNVAVNIDGTVVLNQLKRMDLKQYPSGIITDVSDLYDRELGLYAIETSRGCPWGKCTFCSMKNQFGAVCESGHQADCTWQPFPLPLIFDDLRSYVRQGARVFDVKDSEFFGPVRRTKENDPFWDTMNRAEAFAHLLMGINRELQQIDPNDQVVINHISVRADAVFRKGEDDKNKRRWQVFKLLREAGVKCLYLGIESGSPTQLRRYGKGLNVEENREAINILRNLGFQLELGFIFFDPLATMEDLRQNILFIEDTRIYETDTGAFGSLRVQEASHYVNILQKKGLLGSRQPGSLSYSYQYQNSDVFEVKSIFERWEAATKKLVKLLSVDLRLESYKMNFLFLKEIINLYYQGRQDKVSEVLHQHAKRRQTYLAKINSSDKLLASYLRQANELNNSLL